MIVLGDITHASAQRMRLEIRVGFEPTTTVLQTAALPLSLPDRLGRPSALLLGRPLAIAGEAGFEPAF